VTVAQVGAGVAAFVQGGADRVGELGFDQRLVDRLGGLTDAVTDIGDLKCVQDFEQGRLIQGHRVVPLYRFLGGFLQRLTRWPVQRDQARREDQDLHHSRGRDRSRSPDPTDFGLGTGTGWRDRRGP